MYRKMKVAALIPAAGSGLRMGTKLKKQYLTLNGKEILNWTLIHLLSSQLIDEVVLLVPAEDLHEVEAKVSKWSTNDRFRLPIKVVIGGDTRQESVMRGLNAIDGHTDYVCIHDGVRPFVPIKQLMGFMETLTSDASLEGVVAGLEITDTLKRIDSNQNIIETVDRSCVWSVQTPQIFEYNLLKNAHEIAVKNRLSVTDDAALLESLGKNIRIIQSASENIKITKPFDLIVAEAIFKSYEL